jgi:hypothetical protein
VTSPEEVNKAVAEAMKAGRAAVLLRIKSGNDTRFVGVRPTAKKG